LKLNLSFGAVVGLAVVAVGGVVLWRASSAASGAADALGKWARETANELGAMASAAVEAVNPASPNNLAYRGTNAALTAAAGSPTFVSDGLFAVLQPEARAAERAMLGASVPVVSVYDVEDAEIGAAWRAVNATPAGAYLNYGHAFGRR
jgi:hypothetical protein